MIVTDRQEITEPPKRCCQVTKVVALNHNQVVKEVSKRKVLQLAAQEPDREVSLEQEQICLIKLLINSKNSIRALSINKTVPVLNCKILKLPMSVVVIMVAEAVVRKSLPLLLVNAQMLMTKVGQKTLQSTKCNMERHLMKKLPLHASCPTKMQTIKIPSRMALTMVILLQSLYTT